MQVAIQGIKGCFHEIATLKYFGEREEIDMVECESFPLMFKSLQRQKELFGVMAIENTVAGTILPNYALLRNSDMAVIGEVYLRIKHNLLVSNGQRIQDLKEVRSHPMAILQCHSFFDRYPHIKLIESPDTALSAKEIKEKQLTGIGAIASSLAAEHYKLSMLAESIETNKENYTRFLVLQHKAIVKKPHRSPNKASVCFHLTHKVGSLVNVLQILADQGINLSKIQSLPVIGKVWEYFFHVDLEFKDYENYQKTLQLIQPYIHSFHVLGEYRVGIKHRTS